MTALAASPPPGQPTSLTDDLSKRLDVFLPSLQSDDARRLILRRMLNRFSRDHSEFVRTGGQSAKRDPVFGWPTAWDYHATVSMIRSRLDALKIEEAA